MEDNVLLGASWLRTAMTAAGVSSAILLTVASPANAEVTLTYATYFNANDPLVQVDTWFMEEVTKRTNGEVKFDTYFGGAMLGGPDIYPGLTKGAVDVGMSVPAAFQQGDYILTNVTLPYITDNSVAVTYAFNELLKELEPLRQEYHNQNIKLLYALGFSENTIWSNKPIRTIDDLKGMRIRSVMSIANALGMLGAVPVTMGFGNSVDALQRKVIDGFSSAPFLTSVSVGLQDFAPYVSDGGGMGVYAVSSTGMNKDKWDSLSPEAQKAIEEVAAEVPAHYAKLLDPMVEEAIVKIKDAGKTEVIVMSDEEKAKVRDTVAQPLWDQWLAAASERGVDANAFLQRYRDLVAENAAHDKYIPGLARYIERFGQ